MVQNSTPDGIKTIYLIRHGQTDFNKKGIVQGSGIDSELNETGYRQGTQFFNHYKNTGFKHVFTSALKRTHQTVEGFTRDLNIPHTILPELNEINWGDMEGAVPSEESTALFLEVINAWKNGDLTYNAHNGESALAMYERQVGGLQKIQEIEAGSPLLICMHGRAMRSFICLLTGTPLENMDEFEHGNVCLYILEKHADQLHYSITERNSRIHLHENVS